MVTVVLGRQKDSPCYVEDSHRTKRDVQFYYRTRFQVGDAAEILRDIRKSTNGNVTDVITFDDGLQVIADAIKAAADLPHRDLRLLEILSDKTRFKKLPFGEIIAPYFEVSLDLSIFDIKSRIADRFGYPVVVKPSNAFYSAGVIRINSEDELAEGLNVARRTARLMKISRGSSAIIVEKYIPGDEYAVDGFVVDGKIYCIQVHEKWPKLVGPRFHEQAYITYPASFHEPNVQSAARFAASALAMCGLDNSPFHLEIRKDAQRMYLLEIAARLSGGGTTTQQLAMITSGINSYGVLDAVNRRKFTESMLVPTLARVGLEVDFAVSKPGRLDGVQATHSMCRDLGAHAVFQFKNDGDRMLRDGESVEACLIAYFGVSHRNQAIELFEEVMSKSTIGTTG
ncbi:ATP-grasp domain-containing protein [Rhizobium sp. SJZ105]|uniref:ATP-grasp domain-containing protein n=1 Tax=Rhizobium sp. SJZ105 TaxID=2572678 RepID=UPI0011A068DE|nr:ATP-grasp domain-containing protein [Rhizobium sp. SJZ105]TWC76332.1 ATP-grasp domain-containing protein [Rhizobium sp. SJZ105]